MPFSLFFSYANQDKAHFDEFAKSMKKFVESKDKEGKVLDCENEDLMEEYAENAFAIIVLLSTNYLNYDTSPQRKKLQTKINSGITERNKLIVTVELEDCLYVFDDTYKDVQPNKLEKNNYVEICRKMIEEIKAQKPKISLKKTLSESLFRLNYNEQRDTFNAHFKDLNLLNIVLMRGTPECGHLLLLKKFLRFKKIEFTDEQKLVWLNAEYFSNNQTDSWIWEQLARAFHLFPQGATSNTIGKHVTERLETESIFIRFDDIHLVEQGILDVIKKVWEELYHYISSRGPFKNQIFLFLTDRSLPQADKPYSTKQFSSTDMMAVCDKIFCILPRTKFLDQPETDTWLDKLKDDPDLHILNDYLETSHILQNEQNLESIPIYTAITNIVNKLGDIDPDLGNQKNDFLARLK